MEKFGHLAGWSLFTWISDAIVDFESECKCNWLLCAGMPCTDCNSKSTTWASRTSAWHHPWFWWYGCFIAYKLNVVKHVNFLGK